MLQQAFISSMSAEEIAHETKIEVYLKAIAEAMGVKFK